MAEEDSYADDRASRFGHGGRFLSAFGIRVMVPVAMLLVLAAGLGYFRLRQGPASLTFLVAPIEKGIAAELDGLRPSIEDVVVALTDSGGLEFRLKNLQLHDPDGGVVVAAPFAATQLSGAALWTAQVVPSRVELINPQVFLAYSGTDGLTLRFSQAGTPQSDIDVPEGLRGAPVRAADPSQGALSASGEPGVGVPGVGTQSVDPVKVLVDLLDRAARSGGVSTYLREFGLRDATVILDQEGRKSSWQVPLVSVDVDHRQDRSIVAGVAKISSLRGPWTVSFRTEKPARAQSFDVTLAIRDLVPRTLAEVLPGLGLLMPFDVPVGGDVKVELSEQGTVTGGRIDLEVGHGRLHLSGLSRVPFDVDAGLLRVKYLPQSRQFEMEPSTVRWGESSLTLSGTIVGDEVPEAGNDAGVDVPWRFDIQAQQGAIGVSEFGIAPMPIESWQAVGALRPSRSIVELQSLEVVVGGGSVSISGELDASPSQAGSRLEGRLGAMPSTTFKALWPRGIANAARRWVGTHVFDGQVTSGTMKYFSGRYLREAQPNSAEDHRLAMAVQVADVSVRPVATAPAVDVPRGLVRVENNALEVVVPTASIATSGGHQVDLTTGRFTAINLDDDNSVGEFAVKVRSQVVPVLDLLSDPSLKIMDRSDVPVKKADGKVDGDVRMTLPLNTEVAIADLKFGAKFRLSDGRAKNVFGGYDIQGATVDFDVTESAVDARGEILLAGVLAKLNWQRFLGSSGERQPPLRLTANLDNSDRRQLGMDLGDGVQGEVPVELTVDVQPGGADAIHIRADLTNADLLIESVSWRKPPGQTAFVECDVAEGDRYKTRLSNLRVAGDNIGIEGWVGLDNKNRIAAFEFPVFTLDLVTRLKVSGTLKKGKVWKVGVNGTTYDGRSFFRSLFSVGQVAGRAKDSNATKKGLDLTAKINTVLGFEETSLKNLSLTMSKRNGRLTGLDARGTLGSGKPLAVQYRGGKGQPRVLLADSSDAGEVFRLVGFYPNMQNGRVRLEVQLDGRGAAEKTGILWVEDFKILGDPVVSEVFSSSENGRPSIATGAGRKRRVVREVFPFERMRAPFSVGHGQFVLEDAYLRGPVVGATLRGKVDYTNQVLNIGGTYVPLQGLNNVFGEIPLLGELLSGPRGEGIFAMTFAIQGGLRNPQVIVNPLSFVAPGILREMFQLTPYDPRVQPRSQGAPAREAKRAVRNSSAPAIGDGLGGAPAPKWQAPAGRAVDGWSSKTTPP